MEGFSLGVGLGTGTFPIIIIIIIIKPGSVVKKNGIPDTRYKWLS